MERQEQQRLPPSRQECLLIYDGECRLCAATKGWLEQVGGGVIGKEVRFLPDQSEKAMKVLGDRDRPGRPDRAFLIHPFGEVRQGLEAFHVVASQLPGGKLWLWGLRFPPTKWLTDWGYRTIARYRYRWFGEVKAT